MNHINFPVFSPGRFYINDIETDSYGNVFLLANADSVVTVGSTQLHFSQNSTVIMKLDANLNYIWSQYMYSANQFGTMSGYMAVTDSLIYVGINHNEVAYLHGSSFQFPAPVNSLSFDCFFAALKNNPSVVNSISETKKEFFSIAPNPSTGIFTIHASTGSATAKSAVKVCVYDLLGNCVISQTTNNNQHTTIDLSAKAKGIYFVKVETDKNTETSKIIIQ